MSDRPNVVFILSDDQGPWAAGCYGNTEIRTPSLDKLAAEGMLFENFFCTSPVCSPARASLLTGTIPSRHGVHDWIREGNAGTGAEAYLDNIRCYTDDLADSGWECGLSGKWHLGDSARPQHGFSHWFAHPKGGGPYNDQEMFRDGQLETTTGYLSDVITDDALGFIRSNAEQPFYLSVHYTAPHSPWVGHPQEIVDSYDECAFDSCPQEPVHRWAGPLTTLSHGNREFLKGYFAAVTAMDANIGRILATLEELGLRENTLVIFTSDNGFSCGHHGFWGKGNATFPLNMYDNSVKVPFIISHPERISGGTRSAAMMSQYDLYPTLMDYLHLAPPVDAHLPGVSFAPVLDGLATEVREDVVVYDEYGPVRMIRTRDWKYIHRYPFGEHELYDLNADPDERANRVGDPACADVLTNLRSRLSKWFAEYADYFTDGSRLPISGSGQDARIKPDSDPDACFSNDRIVTSADGSVHIDRDIDLEAFRDATGNRP